jgi:hypothetical protein
MTDVYSNRSNARRAAESMIAKGTAPAAKYGLTAISEADGGGIKIEWQVEAAPADAPEAAPTTAEVVEAEVVTPEPATAVTEPETAEVEAQPEPAQVTPEPAQVEPQPQLQKGDRVKVTLGKKRIRSGTVDYQVDQNFFRVILDGDGVSALVQRHQIALADASDAPAPAAPKAAAPKTVKEPKQPRSAPKTAAVKAAVKADADAAAGVMPVKPVIASKANPGYQKRVDYLAERAAAGDFAAVRAYEVKGVNTYAKMVVRYRDRLLAAHAAQGAQA